MAYGDGLDMVPAESVICFEENLGNIKTLYALYVASGLASEGKIVNYVTLQSRENTLGQMKRLKMPVSESLHITVISADHAREEVLSCISMADATLVIIDPFSVFFAEDSVKDILKTMTDLIKKSRSGTTVLVLLDPGIMGSSQDHLVRAMSDGVIQFVIVPEGDKLKNYINIPKMRGSFPRDKMLPFTLSEEGIMIDTRERHG